jgi:hypothetical protein
MRIVQPSEFNKYVDDTIPLTWAIRWKTIKATLPSLAFSLVLLLEIVAYRSWLDELSPRSILFRLSSIPTLFIFIGVVMEISVRLGHCTSRYLQPQEKRIKTNKFWIPWKRVMGWSLVPIPGQAGLRKLIIAYSFGGRRNRIWSMVLQYPDQSQALKSELDLLRLGRIMTPPLVETYEPEPPNKSVRIRGLVLLLLAMFCLLHGMPMLVGVALRSPEHRSNQSSASNLTPKEKEKLGRFVARYFSSPKDFRQFCLLTGGGLTALGAGLYVWGLITIRKDNPPGMNLPHPT